MQIHNGSSITQDIQCLAHPFSCIELTDSFRAQWVLRLLDLKWASLYFFLKVFCIFMSNTTAKQRIYASEERQHVLSLV